MKRLVFIFMFLLSFPALHAQEAKHYNNNPLIRKGNLLYEQQNFATAENAFQKALQANGKNPIGYYNYGNTLMQQKKYDAARNMYQQTMSHTGDKTLKSKAQHNIGNAYCQEKKWQEAVEAYKSALRNNPSDQETKYNLAYAQKMLQKDQQKNKDQDKDKNKDKDKDKDQDKNKDNQDKKDKDQQKPEDKKDDKDEQNKSDKDDRQNPDQQGGQDKGPMDQRQADAILKALQQNEKKLQSGKNKQGVAPVKLDKDW